MCCKHFFLNMFLNSGIVLGIYYLWCVGTKATYATIEQKNYKLCCCLTPNHPAEHVSMLGVKAGRSKKLTVPSRG